MWSPNLVLFHLLSDETYVNKNKKSPTGVFVQDITLDILEQNNFIMYRSKVNNWEIVCVVMLEIVLLP